MAAPSNGCHGLKMASLDTVLNNGTHPSDRADIIPDDTDVTAARATSFSLSQTTNAPADNVDPVSSACELAQVDPPTLRPPLLELSPELRNIIFEYAVTSQGWVLLDQGVPEPPLLIVNKQVRTESRALFFARNSFGVRNRDYDSAVYFRTAKLTSALMRSCKIKLKVRNCVGRHPSWGNLMEWLERYHAGSVKQKMKPPSQHEDAASSAMLVIGGMFCIVRSMRSQPWSMVREVVAEQQRLLIRLDGRWK